MRWRWGGRGVPVPHRPLIGWGSLGGKTCSKHGKVSLKGNTSAPSRVLMIQNVVHMVYSILITTEHTPNTHYGNAEETKHKKYELYSFYRTENISSARSTGTRRSSGGSEVKSRRREGRRCARVFTPHAGL